MSKEVTMAVSNSAKFYYDIVCPFAYIASHIVKEKEGVTITWAPVLLAGLYEATQAAQGKDGSATDIMSSNKLKITGQDLRRQMVRHNVPYKEPNHHPQKTVNAMRLLAAITDHSTRVGVSKNLYKAYWQEQKDVTQLSNLREAVEPFGLNASDLLESDLTNLLRANTSEAAQRGAFGVPSFYVGNRLYWGTDRVFFVKRALGSESHPERLAVPSSGSAKLTFFFDYSSPWSYLAMERLESIIQTVQPIQVKIEWVPILLGALFKEIGTPMVPLQAMNEAKRKYVSKDLDDWCDYAGVKLKWPNTFPLRTVLPLRVTLAANSNPLLIKHIYRAAWQNNQDIGDPKVLGQVLSVSPVPNITVEQAQSDTIKQQLFVNTQRAVQEGVCGVPSFQVNDGEMVWGQDKLNVVADMLCGWSSPFTHAAKL